MTFRQKAGENIPGHVTNFLAMQLNTFLTTPTIAEILSQSSNSGYITRSEYDELMCLSSGVGSEEELDTIQRLFYALKRGWLRLID